MTRTRRIAVGQSGPLQRGDSREAAVGRLMEMMREAAGAEANVIVFTELALTTFFPRYYAEDRADMDSWFETEMLSTAT